MDDLRAVMDAAGSSRATLLGISEGGAMAVLFAATYPDRTQALILYGAYAHFHSWVLPPEKMQEFITAVENSWGSGESLRMFAPSKLSDESFRRWWARFERLGASPSAVASLMRMNAEIDVRHVLPNVRVPTLVLHRRGDTRVNVAAGRYLAECIPSARYVELSGFDHCLWTGETDIVADEIEKFVTGSVSAVQSDRVLATVVFTDIVNSTGRAVQLGDRKWGMLLDQHNEIVRREVMKFRGRLIRSTGDGFLLAFDGPARAVRCARELCENIKTLGMDIRCGAHTGEIQIKDTEEGIEGIAIHVASRVAALADAGEVLVSSTVRDLVAGSGLHFRNRGTHAMKGLPEEFRIFALNGLAI